VWRVVELGSAARWSLFGDDRRRLRDYGNGYRFAGNRCAFRSDNCRLRLGNVCLAAAGNALCDGNRRRAARFCRDAQAGETFRVARELLPRVLAASSTPSLRLLDQLRRGHRQLLVEIVEVFADRVLVVDLGVTI
jgi:hypothetical protein